MLKEMRATSKSLIYDGEKEKSERQVQKEMKAIVKEELER